MDMLHAMTVCLAGLRCGWRGVRQTTAELRRIVDEVVGGAYKACAGCGRARRVGQIGRGVPCRSHRLRDGLGLAVDGRLSGVLPSSPRCSSALSIGCLLRLDTAPSARPIVSAEPQQTPPSSFLFALSSFAFVFSSPSDGSYPPSNPGFPRHPHRDGPPSRRLLQCPHPQVRLLPQGLNHYKRPGRIYHVWHPRILLDCQ